TIKLEVRLDGGSVGGFALAIEFLDGKHVQRDGIKAEAKLVQGRRVVEQPALAALVLTNQRIGDVQHDVIAERLQAVDFGDGGGQRLRVGFKADEVIDAASRQAVK